MRIEINLWIFYRTVQSINFEITQIKIGGYMEMGMVVIVLRTERVLLS